MASSETRKPNDAATKKDISLPYPGPVIQGQALPKSSGYRTNRINEPAAARNAISSGGDWVQATQRGSHIGTTRKVAAGSGLINGSYTEGTRNQKQNSSMLSPTQATYSKQGNPLSAG